jgi:hypothetical protein
MRETYNHYDWKGPNGSVATTKPDGSRRGAEDAEEEDKEKGHTETRIFEVLLVFLFSYPPFFFLNLCVLRASA